MQVELPLRRKRRLEPHDHPHGGGGGVEYRPTKKRLTQAMGELTIGTPPAPAAEFGHPFGVRTRMRAPSSGTLGTRNAALESLDTLKRALEPAGTEATASAPAPKRQRGDSRALIVYRPPVPAADILLQRSPAHADAPAHPRVLSPIMRTVKIPREFMPDVGATNVNVEGTTWASAGVSTGATTEPTSVIDEDGDLELEPTGAHEALVRVPSLAERRRGAFIRAAMEASSLIRTQNVFLMPWRDGGSAGDGNAGNTGNLEPPLNSPENENDGDMSDMDVA